MLSVKNIIYGSIFGLAISSFSYANTANNYHKDQAVNIKKEINNKKVSIDEKHKVKKEDTKKKKDDLKTS